MKYLIPFDIFKFGIWSIITVGYHFTFTCAVGWCTYYTCLKRLSTFFSLVVVGSDYCVWMTGSPPSTVRFHLLNAGPDDSITLCMWFKTTQRKDVYKASGVVSALVKYFTNDFLCLVQPLLVRHLSRKHGPRASI